MPSELSLEQRAQKRAQREVTRTRFVKEFPATTIAEMNLARQVEELRELEALTTCGVIELMLANPNIDSFVKEKEALVVRLEQQLKERDEEVINWMFGIAKDNIFADGRKAGLEEGANHIENYSAYSGNVEIGKIHANWLHALANSETEKK